jgi:hypothetical protein
MEHDPKAAIAANRRGRWLGRAGVMALGLFGVALLLTACGGGNPGSANSGTSRYEQAAAYAQCMRSHGVPSFPDPKSNGEFALLGNLGIDPGSPQFHSAQTACQHLDPSSGIQSPAEHQSQVNQTLKYVNCMRLHGIPNFPDPPATGQQTINPESLGIDPNSPTYRSAQQMCRKYLPGGGVGAP